MNKRKSALMRDLLPRVRVELPVAGKIDLGALFQGDDAPKSIWLEVGFGGGEHLAARAQKYPESGFIGCEPFENGVASLMDHIDRMGLFNVRVYPDDARVLMDVLPDACLDGAFVLYPDPWPKKRHHERRFINFDNLDRFARVLKVNAELRLATDVADLAVWMYDQARAHPSFGVVYDSSVPPEGWTTTRYEDKGVKAGRQPRYIVFRRKR